MASDDDLNVSDVSHADPSRQADRRRAILLQYGVIAYNLLECLASLLLGLLAGSLALVGFGLDGAIEVSASVAVLLHLKRNRRDEPSVWDRRVAIFVGLTLLVLAFYLWNDAILKLAFQRKPDASYLGIAIAVASLLIMPRVARVERDLAHNLNSRALEAESRETLVCAWLSAALLFGLAANAAFGWWWADPVVAMAMVGFVGREGWEAVTRQELHPAD